MEIYLYTKIENKCVKIYISINGFEFDVDKLEYCIEELLTTKVNDKWGKYSLFKNNIIHIDEMNKLVDLGIAKKYLCGHLDEMYCISNYNDLITIYDSFLTVI